MIAHTLGISPFNTQSDIFSTEKLLLPTQTASLNNSNHWLIDLIPNLSLI